MDQQLLFGQPKGGSIAYNVKNGIYQFVEDKDTETWDAYWKRIPVYDEVLDFLRKMMNLQLRRYLKSFLVKDSSTLEPGGGSAYVSALFADEGINSYALDYAYKPLAIAKGFGSKAKLVQGDMFNMPFPDGTFDLTFNNSTMEHLDRPLESLKEMARVTKPGKYVFVGVPHTYGPLAVYKLKKSSFKGAWDGNTYDKKRLERLFRDAGLDVVKTRTFFFRCFIGTIARKR